MIEYKIKTWGCTQCEYRQDFEPTTEAMQIHFNDDPKFRVRNIQAYECPSCALDNRRENPMIKVTDLTKKMLHRYMVPEDLVQLRTELIAEAVRQITDENGNKRNETAGEKSIRIDKIIASFKLLTPQQIVEMRLLYEDK